MRRFLRQVLQSGFHRIRHYGLLANGSRKTSLPLARALLDVARAVSAAADNGDTGHSASAPTFICWHCGHAMIVLQTFARRQTIRAPPAS